MEKRTIHVVSAAIERDGSYLITQRLEKAVFPLLWEFPGGKIEAGENKEQALIRSDPLKLNKGAGAALACLSLVDIKQSYKHE